nr:spermidine synthase [Anopheles coluzzii]
MNSPPPIQVGYDGWSDDYQQRAFFSISFQINVKSCTPHGKGSEKDGNKNRFRNVIKARTRGRKNAGMKKTALDSKTVLINVVAVACEVGNCVGCWLPNRTCNKCLFAFVCFLFVFAIQKRRRASPAMNPSEWFSEISNELWPGQCFSVKVKQVLHEERSKYQDIKIIQSESHGVVLILDGIIQCTERDEFAYQEMISFLPLCCHPNPQRVLIVGGGDGGVAREVAKHPAVLEVHQVEIDERVVELSKQYLPFMACGFESPKLKLTIGDGFEYMKQHEGAFDVIITDSSDPIGPAESLFRESYFELVKRALKPNGIICSQGGSFWLDAGHVRETLDYCRKHFPRVTYGLAAVPSYPTGQIGFFIASLNPETEFREPARQFEDAEIDQLGLRYYTTDVHRAAFTLPRFAAKALNP